MSDKPKPLKGFLQKRGPKEYHGWKRRWFVLEGNVLTYYKVRWKRRDDATRLFCLRIGVTVTRACEKCARSDCLLVTGPK